MYFLYSSFSIVVIGLENKMQLKAHLYPRAQDHGVTGCFVAARVSNILNTRADIQPGRYGSAVIEFENIFIIVSIGRRGLVAENALGETQTKYIIIPVFQQALILKSGAPEVGNIVSFAVCITVPEERAKALSVLISSIFLSQQLVAAKIEADIVAVTFTGGSIIRICLRLRVIPETYTICALQRAFVGTELWCDARLEDIEEIILTVERCSEAGFSYVGLGVGNGCRYVPSASRAVVDGHAETIVWKRDGRIVYQSAVEELRGFIIGVITAIKCHRAAVVLKSAGKVHLTQTNTERITPKRLLIP